MYTEIFTQAQSFSSINYLFFFRLLLQVPTYEKLFKIPLILLETFNEWYIKSSKVSAYIFWYSVNKQQQNTTSMTFIE